MIRLRGELAGAPLALEIRHEPGGVRFGFSLRIGVAIPAVARLVAASFAAATDGTLGRTVPRDEAIDALWQAVRILRETYATRPVRGLSPSAP